MSSLASTGGPEESEVSLNQEESLQEQAKEAKDNNNNSAASNNDQTDDDLLTNLPRIPTTGGVLLGPKNPKLLDVARSRSRSPSRTDTRLTTTTYDANSSISSFDDYEDILYDRAGMQDDLSESQRKLHSSKEFHCPPTVMERMTDDMLEDSHAFSDVKSSNASRVSGSHGGDIMLEPLDECCEEGSVESAIPEEEEVASRIILTNMENLNLQFEPRNGEESETPSAPTV